MESGDLDGGQDPGDDQGGGYEILGTVCSQSGASLTGDDDGRGDDAGQHGQCVLEAQEQSEEDGHAVVETEERSGLFRLLHKG